MFVNHNLTLGRNDIYELDSPSVRSGLSDGNDDNDDRRIVRQSLLGDIWRTYISRKLIMKG